MVSAELLCDMRRGVTTAEDVHESWWVNGRAGVFCMMGEGGGAWSFMAGGGGGQRAHGGGRVQSCMTDGGDGWHRGGGGVLFCITGGGDGEEGGSWCDPEALDAAICARIFTIVLIVLMDDELWRLSSQSLLIALLASSLSQPLSFWNNALTICFSDVLYFNQYLHIPVVLHVLKQSLIFSKQVNDTVIECKILEIPINFAPLVSGRDTVPSLCGEDR